MLAYGPETIRLLAAPGPDGAPAHLALSGAAGDLLTLLPLGADAEGVSTDGMYYPLAGETLYEGRARGVSAPRAAAGHPDGRRNLNTLRYRI